jgi:DUF4097 and DUF4098 domain-containing protein YvlB
MKRIPILLLLSCFILSAIRAQVPDDYSFKKAFKITTPANMSIKTSDGFIKTYSSDTDEILVYFIVKKNNRVMDIDLEELEDHVEVDISSTSNSLEIVIKQEETEWLTNWTNRYNVSMQIIAPANTECTLQTSDGDIELINFKGDHTCRTSDGNIEAEEISGSLNARTSDGNIEVLEVNGPVELQTSDGDILAENITGDCNVRTSDGKIVAKNVNGDVSAVTSDGNILLVNANGEHSVKTSDGDVIFEDITGGLTAQTSDGDIRGDFRDLKDALSLKTSDGNISVTVPDGLGMDVHLRGEDIHTRLEHFSGDTSDHKIEGRIRGGGVEVELATSDGDISLNYR